jgi:catechol 2,3-dioxygenase-like lactoylglutathione lyase family enzyme
MAGEIFQKGCPTLAALDMKATLAWYRDKLGFTVALDYDDYGIVSRDDVEIHFWLCEDRKIAEATSAYIRVADINAAHHAMKHAREGGRLSDPTDRPYGLVEFEVFDPNGNLLRVGQRRSPAVAA